MLRDRVFFLVVGASTVSAPKKAPGGERLTDT